VDTLRKVNQVIGVAGLSTVALVLALIAASHVSYQNRVRGFGEGICAADELGMLREPNVEIDTEQEVYTAEWIREIRQQCR
jgi:hypothetical protein